ncbi:MAG TPA: hypothetical protein VMK31_03005 [Sphingomicrobium sp.]|nr:hypothetical protein [Sphingomicrobium sp.]
MSAPVRFLVVAIAGWAAVRFVTLGDVSGFTVSHARQPPPALPPIAATEFPPLPPVAFAEQPRLVPGPLGYWPAGAAAPQPYYLPYPRAVPASLPARSIPPRPAWQLPQNGQSRPDFYEPITPLDDWQVASFAGLPGRSSPAPTFPGTPDTGAQPLDRLQLSSWAFLRGNPTPGTLAAGGTLGGSQAGARVTYAFKPWLAASLRTSSPVGGSYGAEVAGGVRIIPFRSIPVAITAERRQSISRHGGGRSAFALFIEGGLYRRPMPWSFSLDAYAQAGVVGFRSRDLFFDGALAFTRPVYGRFSAGFGVWGGAQPGIYRLDAGPRVSMRVRDNISAHLDWRHNLAGNAEPGSGPALTLAADF